MARLAARPDEWLQTPISRRSQGVEVVVLDCFVSYILLLLLRMLFCCCCCLFVVVVFVVVVIVLFCVVVVVVWGERGELRTYM